MLLSEGFEGIEGLNGILYGDKCKPDVKSCLLALTDDIFCDM